MKFKKTTDKISGQSWHATHDDSSWRSGLIDLRLPRIDLLAGQTYLPFSVDGYLFSDIADAKKHVRSIAKSMGIIG